MQAKVIKSSKALQCYIHNMYLKNSISLVKRLLVGALAWSALMKSTIFPPGVVCAVSPMGEAIGELQADGEWLVLGVKG